MPSLSLSGSGQPSSSWKWSKSSGSFGHLSALPTMPSPSGSASGQPSSSAMPFTVSGSSGTGRARRGCRRRRDPRRRGRRRRRLARPAAARRIALAGTPNAVATPSWTSNVDVAVADRAPASGPGARRRAAASASAIGSCDARGPSSTTGSVSLRHERRRRRDGLAAAADQQERLRTVRLAEAQDHVRAPPEHRREVRRRARVEARSRSYAGATRARPRSRACELMLVGVGRSTGQRDTARRARRPPATCRGPAPPPTSCRAGVAPEVMRRPRSRSPRAADPPAPAGGRQRAPHSDPPAHERSSQAQACIAPASRRRSSSASMLTFSTNPDVAEQQMNAIIFYLTAFGYIDGEFDFTEKTFVRIYIRQLVTARAKIAMPDADAEDARRGRSTSSSRTSTRCSSRSTARSRRCSTRRSPTARTSRSSSTRSSSCAATRSSRASTATTRTSCSSTIDELIYADGSVHPAEEKFRDELEALLDKPIAARRRRHRGRPRPSKVAIARSGRASRPRVDDHPFFAAVRAALLGRSRRGSSSRSTPTSS